MDLQVLQDFDLHNYAYIYNYEIVAYTSLLFVLIIIVVDYINFKTRFYNELQRNNTQLQNFDQFNKKNILQLEKNIQQLEKKLANINKCTNATLENNLDYINKQLLIQNANIEEINLKLFNENEETTSKLLRNIMEIKVYLSNKIDESYTILSNEIEELEDQQVKFSNKLNEMQIQIPNQIEEKLNLQQKVIYDMYRYLYFGLKDGSIIDGLQGFFKHFYGFNIPTVDEDMHKSLNSTHPARLYPK
jgi:hypothetical protein